MRVALADDSALFRDGLRLLLDSAGVEVTASARSGEDLIAQVATDPPDAVILDVRMPPTFTDEGLAVAEQLRARLPGMGILVLSAYVDPSYAVRLLTGGGHGMGLLSKDRVADLDTLVDALTRLHDGESVIDQEIVSQLFNRPGRARVLGALTARERDVLSLMAEGRANAAIAESLGLSERTVEAYNATIFDKLAIPVSRGANRRVLAVLAWLREEGAPSS
ncbi:MAG: response regulator transcription factor [Nocardioidaceae bacterium]